MDRIKYDLRTVINLIDWTHISKTFLDSNIQTIKRVECIQNYKISELMGRKLQNDPKKIIHNFSSYQLSDTEKLLLCKGLNFALPPKRLRFENYLLPFELLYRDVYDSENKDESLLHLKSKIKNVGLSSYRIYNKKDHCYENLSPEEYDAFINLSSNKIIIIQKADKGNSVVIINRTHYVKEMEKLLSDTNKFVKVEFNSKHKVNKELRHLLDIQSSIKDCLDDLYSNNYLSKADHKNLIPVGSKPGIMYGLCKVHKYNSSTKDIPPFRPILSAIGTATYNLAKFFVPILKDFTVSGCAVRGSFSFCEGIEGRDSTLFVASFGIRSLFTNIPLDETVGVCVDRAFQNGKEVRGLLKRRFKQLLTLVVKSSCFVFNDTCCQQVGGVAMGSPLGPAFANLFLVYYEYGWLGSCPLRFRPKFYRHCVDDIFLMFQKKEHVKKFFGCMNSRRQNVGFTFEGEQDDKVSFLGVSITRVRITDVAIS